MMPLPQTAETVALRAPAPQLQRPDADPVPDVSGVGGMPLADTPVVPPEPVATADAGAGPAVQGNDDTALVAVEVPAGSEFSKGRPDVAPLLPGTDAMPERLPSAAPVPIDPMTSPQPDTAQTARVDAAQSVATPQAPQVDGVAPTAPVMDAEMILPTPLPVLPQGAGAEAAVVADLQTPQPPSNQVQSATAVLAVEGEAASGVAGAPLGPAMGEIAAAGSAAEAAQTVAATGTNPIEAQDTPGTVQADAAFEVAAEATARPEVQERLIGAEVAPDAASPDADLTTAVVTDPQAVTATPAQSAIATDAAQAVSPQAEAQSVAGTAPVLALPAAETDPAQTPQVVADADVSALRPPSTKPSVTTLPRNSARTPEGQQAAQTFPPRVVGTEVPPQVEERLPEPAGGIGVRVTPITDRDKPATLILDRPAFADQTDGTTAAPKLSALSRNAAVFDGAKGQPLFSVILIDAGARGLDRDTLTTFSFPVTFAVDPTAPDAAQAIDTYRRAGFEVVLLATGFPNRATPQDVETTLAAHLAAFPQAIGLMDLSGGVITRNRALATQVIEGLAEEGLGLVTFDSGLNATQKTADAKGVPNALIFRSLDDGQEHKELIRRYLDRAAFKAAQDGYVIMVGHSYAETVTALFEWALTGRAGQVAIAPVSATLKAR